VRDWLWAVLLLAIIVGARLRVSDGAVHAFDAVGAALLVLALVLALWRRERKR
jgi:hypothetical protein